MGAMKWYSPAERRGSDLLDRGAGPRSHWRHRLPGALGTPLAASSFHADLCPPDSPGTVGERFRAAPNARPGEPGRVLVARHGPGAEGDRERRRHPHGRSAGDLLACLLYTSDAADERSSVDLGGRRIIKK